MERAVSYSIPWDGWQVAVDLARSEGISFAANAQVGGSNLQEICGDARVTVLEEDAARFESTMRWNDVQYTRLPEVGARFGESCDGSETKAGQPSQPDGGAA